MKRREFIKKTILGAGAVALFPAAVSSRPAPKYFYFRTGLFDYNNEVGIVLLICDERGVNKGTWATQRPIGVSCKELDIVLEDFRREVPFKNLRPAHLFPENETTETGRIRKYLSENFV